MKRKNFALVAFLIVIVCVGLWWFLQLAPVPVKVASLLGGTKPVTIPERQYLIDPKSPALHPPPSAPMVPPPAQPHPPQSPAQALPASPISDQQRSAIENNLRQLFVAAQYYILDHNDNPDKPVYSASLSDIVGDGTHLQTITPVAGEDYTSIIVSITDTEIHIVTPSGETVSHKFDESDLGP